MGCVLTPVLFVRTLALWYIQVTRVALRISWRVFTCAVLTCMCKTCMFQACMFFFCVYMTCLCPVCALLRIRRDRRRPRRWVSAFDPFLYSYDSFFLSRLSLVVLCANVPLIVLLLVNLTEPWIWFFRNINCFIAGILWFLPLLPIISRYLEQNDFTLSHRNHLPDNNLK